MTENQKQPVAQREGGLDAGLPHRFIYGAAAAAYQVEGAWNEDGRGVSIWDTFSHIPGKVHNNDTGDVADDFYHRYEEDIELMRKLGIKAFRFSISWSRILPDGRGPVNQKGVDFYNKVLDALEKAGIKPFVTLYHWDLPQPLQDEYGGWAGEESVADFAAYAEACFEVFGARVKYWTTFNEPWSFVLLGYGFGLHAPGHQSGKEAMLATHNVLNAHAAAVKIFRRLVPGGKISMNLNCEWANPYSDSPEDKEAAQRHLDFIFGVFADPVYFGDYPASVRAALPDLPTFTEEQRKLLVGSMDYFSLNHYTTKFVKDGGSLPENTTVLTERDGMAIGPQADSFWLYVVPWGLRATLSYIDQRYGHPPIYITENGCDVPGESSIPFPDVLNDTFRVQYFQDYLDEALTAVRIDGVDLRGYFAWSILDNFEWADGYNYRFGIVYVDYKNNLTRTPKMSSKWLASFFSPGAEILAES
eukprot:jgi/Botrbrau1/15916/Bobra.40_1s0097.2